MRLTTIALLVPITLFCHTAGADPLPGTEPLDLTGDLSIEVVDQVDRWLLKETARLADARPQDRLLSKEGRKALRDRLRHVLGMKDQRVAPQEFELVATRSIPALVAQTPKLSVFAIRWSVFDGVDGEGLLLEPPGDVLANVVAIPDADQTPEEIAGLTPDAPAGGAWARRLAETGCRVVVPVLIDRRNDWSGNPRVAMTNQSHREWICRQSYYVGRHILGYEVQKVLAACDLLQREPRGGTNPLGVAGYGEGGLVALYAAAVDRRIERLLVSGAFAPMEDQWQQPIERNVWGLLRDFGAAELAALSNAKSIVVESCRSPELKEPRGPRPGNQSATGRLITPAVDDVSREVEKANRLIASRTEMTEATDPSRSTERNLHWVKSDAGPAATVEALANFLPKPARANLTLQFAPVPLVDLRNTGSRLFDPAVRQRRQFEQLTEFTQRTARLSPVRRVTYWEQADTSSLDRWRETTAAYRATLRREIIGETPAPDVPMNPRTREIYRTQKFTGYEVVLDVWSEVISYGILLVPNDIPTGERRPVVVTQHGRAGRPQDVCDPEKDTQYYHGFGARLAERGFVVFAPQNLYLGEEKYRQLQRKATPLGYTFFAPMVRMHERFLGWLGGLPFVDSERIGFYGLSYGGKSAMLLPAAIPGYALSICSGDFNEQVWKHTSLEHRFSFQFTNEHDHTEFDIADTFNYAEIAGLIAPRPFLVERGHRDGVSIDEWVAYEYARVKRRYLQLGIADRTEIVYVEGGHEINLQATLPFLEKHLKPKK